MNLLELIKHEWREAAMSNITSPPELTPSQLFWGNFYIILHEEAENIRLLQKNTAAASSVSEAGNAATVRVPPSDEAEQQSDSTLQGKLEQIA
jgi:hypothetical protein